MSLRFYLFPDAGAPLRMSHRLVNGLIAGEDSMPAYSGTKQRALLALLEMDEDGKPVQINRTEASIWTFDHMGNIGEGLDMTMALAMDSLPTPKSNGTVVDLRPRAAKRTLEKEHKWAPEKADIDRIVADIWPKKKTDRLKAAAGVSKLKPTLTWDAKEALHEISGDFWKISIAIDRLKEPSQKAFGFAARERAKSEPEYSHLYRAIADMSDRQLELLKRRRTGKGIWYAVVDVTIWRDGVGETLRRYHERCEGRKAAVVAARALLAKHAHRLDNDTTVEAEVLTDLEWEHQSDGN